jgi:inosine-uridine nucleoside N-ribohydrolase
MIYLIYDCDITMGLPGRDVDDGLALLYLLGSPQIRILGITTTFGNSTIEEVHPCLLSVLNDLGHSDIPAYRGAPRPEETSGRGSEPRDSEAARFLADTVRQNPGTVRILATGSPTNLLGAYRLNPGFFHDVKEIVFMGGIVGPLLINSREIKELNFASDPEAALYALYAGHPPAASTGADAPPRTPDPGRCAITVISGNLCLQARLSREGFDAFLDQISENRAQSNTAGSHGGKGFATYLKEKILPWFSWIEGLYGLPGFHAWDATAALYITDPHLFETATVVLHSHLDDLGSGFLRIEPTVGDPADSGDNSWRINLPKQIRDMAGYWRTLFDGWRRAGEAWPQ